MAGVTHDRWFYTTNGKDYGPVSWSVIESMVQDDRLSRGDLVVQEGDANHLRIEEALQLRKDSEARRESHLMEQAVGIAGIPSRLAEVSPHENRFRTPASGAITASVAESAPDPPLTSPNEYSQLPNLLVPGEYSGEYQLQSPPEPPAELEPALPISEPERPAAGKSRSTRVKLDVSVPVVEAHSTESSMVIHPRQLVLGLEMGLIWAGACVLAVLLGSFLGTPYSPFVQFLCTCLTLIYYTMLATAVSHMRAEELDTQICPGSAAGWRFVMERGIPLLWGPLFVAFAAGSVAAVSGTAIHGLAHLKSVGPFLGSLLLVPTFLAFLAVEILFVAGLMLPVIMGVEDQGPTDAWEILKRRHSAAPLRYLLDLLTVMAEITPVLLFSLVLFAAGLGAAFHVTFDWSQLTEFSWNLSSVLFLFACFLIVASWLAFAIILVGNRLTRMYLNSPGSRDSN